MARKTLGQLRTQGALMMGQKTTNGITNDFDTTTDITLTLANTFINDTIRETLSEYSYNFLWTDATYPFVHTQNNVVGAFLIGTAASGLINISGNVVPFPNDNLNIGQVQAVNFSGASFTGFNAASGVSYAGISTSGFQTINTLSTIGHFYELNPDVEIIRDIRIPQYVIKLGYANKYDLDRVIANGPYSYSGIPTFYTDFPGISASGNKMIQFFPSPDASKLSGFTFAIQYKKQHVDLVNDTDIQSVIPTQFQDIILNGFLEKGWAQINQFEKSELYANLKQKRITMLKKFSETNPDYMQTFRDGNQLNNQGIVSNTDVAASSIFWN